MQDFEKIWDILEEAFPPNERRSKEAQRNLLMLHAYHITPYYEGEQLVGFLCYWNLGDFIFVEHLAVEEGYRGKGYGRKMMKNLLEQDKGKVILEVEYPEDDISRKRIKFYESLGFKLNSIEYLQPSYGTGKEAVSLLLMSYPNSLGEVEAREVIKEVHKEVYHVS
ncbi:GNAT family N-acetyltransferase [Alkaliphilus hydrothermalis]|uniref:Ribosomal protein S18 acetylase RimI-like enzyme n=1 Tax=Alkaliphilus hydrothermalis TaxID=1482730 RepID=A0ABS2NRQ1_9FIRM|nr:GNAT family N-acetyltransferase [Alkaliphilus hydrothermalis]MBM7615452.1 ribosomal protein S18 acetylase RimI-like enzyme [Alkaliphilus hydrothermalis]